jgi:hypothetical protein
VWRDNFESQPEGRRKEEGEPTLKLVEDVENDLYGLKVNRWRPQANNKEWASVTKEA